MPGYNDLVEQALNASLRGWDFSRLGDRTSGGSPSWRYTERASALLPAASRLLDLDTGGGEVLASLASPAPLPRRTVATEAWPPNIPVAAERHRPLGATVLGGTADAVPVGESTFDLVLDRHGALNAAEIARVLAPGGRFLTQQVGTRNDVELNAALGAPVPDPEAWTSAVAVDRLRRHGFRVLDAREEMIDYVFHDIGAVVFHLRAVPWQVPGFDPGRYERPLRSLHERIRSEGSFTVRNHRFLVEAVLPGI